MFVTMPSTELERFINSFKCPFDEIGSLHRRIMTHMDEFREILAQEVEAEEKQKQLSAESARLTMLLSKSFESTVTVRLRGLPIKNKSHNRYVQGLTAEEFANLMRLNLEALRNGQVVVVPGEEDEAPSLICTVCDSKCAVSQDSSKTICWVNSISHLLAGSHREKIFRIERPGRTQAELKRPKVDASVDAMPTSVPANDFPASAAVISEAVVVGQEDEIASDVRQVKF